MKPAELPHPAFVARLKWRTVTRMRVGTTAALGFSAFLAACAADSTTRPVPTPTAPSSVAVSPPAAATKTIEPSKADAGSAAPALPAASAAPSAKPRPQATCIEPRALTRVERSAVDAAGDEFPASFNELAPRADGLAVRLLPDPVDKAGVPMLVAVVEKDGKEIATLNAAAPAGGAVDVTLSGAGKYIIWSFSRSGPFVQAVSGGAPGIALPWGSIMSPDERYVLEPAHAHGFTMRLEHGRNVQKLDLATGKKRIVAHVPEAAVAIPAPDNAIAMNQQTAVAIAPTGCVYAVTHPRALAVMRASDDRVLAKYSNPGPVSVLRWSASGRFLALRNGGKETFLDLAAGTPPPSH